MRVSLGTGVLLDDADALLEKVAEDSDTVLLGDVHDLNARRILGNANTKTNTNFITKIAKRCTHDAAVLEARIKY